MLPVGTREEARLLLDRIVPDAPADRIRAPSRARWKTPLRYHYLSWGRNETCVVTTSGRVARVTDWAPLAKVQSLRWVQGPLQRRFRLATIHVDTAGRNVHAAIRDRDTDDSDRILIDLIASCRTARRWSYGARAAAVLESREASSTGTEGTLTVAIPTRPDVATPPSTRWHWPGLEIALIAPLAWIGTSWAAWRSLGWYPLPSAKVFFLLGWVPVLILGLALGFLASALRRRTVGALLVAVAVVVPLLAAHYLPGVKQQPEYPIPGRPWLAFSAAPNGRQDLYLMKGDAEHVVALGETSWAEISVALSPNRRHIAFAATRAGISDLWAIDLDSRGNRVGTRLLTALFGLGSDVTWSPDGRRIAYSVRSGSLSTIEVIGDDGGTPTVLARNALNPAWSPDGRAIAYSAPSPSHRGDYDIWVIGADGSHPRDVIDATPIDWAPKWSPDGRRIAFTGAVEHNWDVYIANSDGGGIRDLTQGSGAMDETEGWSPDGSKILFLSDRSHTGGTFLYFMDPDGTGVRLALRI